MAAERIYGRIYPKITNTTVANARIWLENLKAKDRYKKAKNRLATDEGFCCLGVALDCLIDGYWGRKTFDGVQKWAFQGYQPYQDTLRPHHLRRLGLSDADQRTLASTNDRNETFKEVIAIIEEGYGLGVGGVHYQDSNPEAEPRPKGVKK